MALAAVELLAAEEAVEISSQSRLQQEVQGLVVAVGPQAGENQTGAWGGIRDSKGTYRHS